MRAWLLVMLAIVGGCAKKDRLREMSLEDAARQGDLQQVQWLIARGASVNARRASWGSTPLEAAAAYGHVEVAQVLIACGAHVRAVDEDGVTALHRAARAGHSDMVRLLIEKGADINAAAHRRWEAGWTPLHCAAEYGPIEVVRLLLDGGANPNIKDKAGRTPAVVAMEHRQKETAQLLVRAGADVTFLLASYIGDAERVGNLIGRGENINMRDRDGCSALHLAALGGYRDVVRILLRAGADVRAEDNRGDTPLHCAVSASAADPNIIQMLLDAGADVDAESSPFDCIPQSDKSHGCAVFIGEEPLIRTRGSDS